MSSPQGSTVAEFGPDIAYPPALLHGWDNAAGYRQMMQITSINFALQVTAASGISTLTTSGPLQLCSLSYDALNNLVITPFASGGRSPLSDLPPLAIGFQELSIPGDRPFLADNVAYVSSLHTQSVDHGTGAITEGDGSLFLYFAEIGFGGGPGFLGGTVVDGPNGTLDGVPGVVNFDRTHFYVDPSAAINNPGVSYQWLDNAIVMPAFP